MKIGESQLYKVYYNKKFNGHFLVEDDYELLLNRIHVYTIKDNEIVEEVNFKIKRKNCSLRIIPDEDSIVDDYDNFMLTGERLVTAKRVIVDPGDIIDKIEHNDGGYTFIINDCE